MDPIARLVSCHSLCPVFTAVKEGLHPDWDTKQRGTSPVGVVAFITKVVLVVAALIVDSVISLQHQ